MSFSSRLLGRRAIAAIVSVGMVTSVVTVAPETFIAPAMAMPPGATPTPGDLSIAVRDVTPGQTLTVTGTGFAPRTEGQSLAVDLLQKNGDEKKYFDLGDSTEGSTFDKMVERDDNSGAHYGLIESVAKLPTEANKGTFTFTVKIPADTVPGNYAIAVKGGAYGKNAPSVVKMVPVKVASPSAFFGRSDAPNILSPIAGTTVTGTFTNLAPGTKVTAVGVSNDEGKTIAANWLPAGDYMADDKGEAIVPGIVIPADAEVGKSIYTEFTLANGTKVLEKGKRYGINPNVAETNADAIKVLATSTTDADNGGLYQSAYDAKDKKLFVTRTNFFNETSDLYVANPDTLALTSIAKNGDGLGGAMFGLAYDAATNTLWTTNTKGMSVTVYNTDGTKVATLPLSNPVGGKNKAHPRDIVIDNTTGKAYVGDAAAPGGKIYVYDTKNVTNGKAPDQTISIPVFGDRGPMEMKIDEKTQTLWTVGFNGKYLAKVELNNGNTVTPYELGNADQENGNRGAGIAIDTKRGKVYAASQSPSHIQVFDIATGKVEKTLVTGGATLDALYDPVKDVVYTVNRVSGTVNVIDPATYEILATKSIAPYPNQLATDGMGNVFVTTKAFSGRYPVGSKFKEDTLYKITFDKKDENPADKGDKKDNDGSSNGLSSDKDDNKAQDPKDKKDDSSSNGLSSDKDDNKAKDPKDKKDDGSSNGLSSDKDDNKAKDPKDKKDDSSSEGGSTIGIVAVIAALVAAIGFAFQSGALKQFLPAGFTLPGLPQ